jgi:hypothetical protein
MTCPALFSPMIIIVLGPCDSPSVCCNELLIVYNFFDFLPTCCNELLIVYIFFDFLPTKYLIDVDIYIYAPCFSNTDD